MFCPNCNAEYRDGFIMCADCDLPLVYTLPEEKLPPDPHMKSIEILRTDDAADIA